MATTIELIRAGLRLICKGFRPTLEDRFQRRQIINDQTVAVFVLYVKSGLSIAFPDVDDTSFFIVPLHPECLVLTMEYWLAQFVRDFPNGRQNYVVNFDWDFSYAVSARLLFGTGPVPEDVWEDMEEEISVRLGL